MTREEAIQLINRFRGDLEVVLVGASRGDLSSVQSFSARHDLEVLFAASQTLSEFIDGRLTAMRGQPIAEILEAMWGHFQLMAAMETLNKLVMPMTPPGPDPFASLDQLLVKK